MQAQRRRILARMNTLRARLAVFALPLLLAACGHDTPPPRASTGDYAAQVWALPAEPGSLAPTLRPTPDGRLLLGWINRREGRRTALQFAIYNTRDGWQSQPRTIAVGNALAAGPADPPHLLATADGALWAQWVQAQPDQAGGTDVVLARSRDGGMRWEQITRVNSDGMPTEHGFAALWPDGSDALGIAWLDGRAKTRGHGEAEDSGDMQLRVNRFDLNLQRGTDTVLDTRTCDCCTLAVAMTARGPLLAWRDRSPDDVRDIVVARWQNGAWSAPRPVHADHWVQPGCPVNGPALAARGDTVALAWYTEADGGPRLRLALSRDAGTQFAAPVDVDQGPGVLGRAAVALDAQQVWVAWLREDASGQHLTLARYAPDLSHRLQTLDVATLATRGLASGYPSLAVDADGAWLVWTDQDANGAPRLKGVQLTR